MKNYKIIRLGILESSCMMGMTLTERDYRRLHSYEGFTYLGTAGHDDLLDILKFGTDGRDL